jgi:hypothetical protein
MEQVKYEIRGWMNGWEYRYTLSAVVGHAPRRNLRAVAGPIGRADLLSGFGVKNSDVISWPGVPVERRP